MFVDILYGKRPLRGSGSIKSVVGEIFERDFAPAKTARGNALSRTYLYLISKLNMLYVPW